MPKHQAFKCCLWTAQLALTYIMQAPLYQRSLTVTIKKCTENKKSFLCVCYKWSEIQVRRSDQVAWNTNVCVHPDHGVDIRKEPHNVAFLKSLYMHTNSVNRKWLKKDEGKGIFVIGALCKHQPTCVELRNWDIRAVCKQSGVRQCLNFPFVLWCTHCLFLGKGFQAAWHIVRQVKEGRIILIAGLTSCATTTVQTGQVSALECTEPNVFLEFIKCRCCLIKAVVP